MSTDTSKSSGAVTVMSASSNTPLTAMDCAAEGVPETVEKPERLEGLTEMVGVVGGTGLARRKPLPSSSVAKKGVYLEEEDKKSADCLQ